MPWQKRRHSSGHQSRRILRAAWTRYGSKVPSPRWASRTSDNPGETKEVFRRLSFPVAPGNIREPPMHLIRRTACSLDSHSEIFTMRSPSLSIQAPISTNPSNNLAASDTFFTADKMSSLWPGFGYSTLTVRYRSVSVMLFLHDRAESRSEANTPSLRSFPSAGI